MNDATKSDEIKWPPDRLQLADEQRIKLAKYITLDAQRQAAGVASRELMEDAGAARMNVQANEQQRHTVLCDRNPGYLREQRIADIGEIDMAIAIQTLRHELLQAAAATAQERYDSLASLCSRMRDLLMKELGYDGL